MLDNIYISLQCAVVAYIYGAVLMDEGKVLHWWSNLLDDAYTDAVNNNKRLKERIIYMLRCDLCFSGQLALWYYILANFHSIDLPSLIFTISLAILFTKTLQRWS